MTLILLLIALSVQRYLHINSYTYQTNWVEPYFGWMSAKVTHITEGHGLMGFIILILPVLIIVSIIFALIYHLLGWLGYYILGLVFLWYCLDARDLRKSPHENMGIEAFFIHSYQKLFGVIFWFFLFGPVGLALHVSVMDLRLYLDHHPEKYPNLYKYTKKAQGVLDWVPMRLLGLSFALVGHFSTVLKPWLHELLHGIKDDQSQVAEWGMAALVKKKSRKAKSEGEPESEVGNSSFDMSEAILLVDRSLLVWLVVIALFSIGYWLG